MGGECPIRVPTAISPFPSDLFLLYTILLLRIFISRIVVILPTTIMNHDYCACHKRLLRVHFSRYTSIDRSMYSIESLSYVHVGES